MEALPIFLDRLVPPYVAILLSVTFVLLFGEIIPQAICTRWGLAIGAYFSWAVWILIVLFFVISYPLSLLLDCILGHEVGTFYRRTEMKALIDMQQKSSDKHSALSYMEAEIIKGAIDLKEKQAKEIMTPKEKVAMLSFDDVLDLEKLQQITKLGHSRFPIYHNNTDNIIGMLLVKKLILLDPYEGVPISQIPLVRLPSVTESTPLYTVLGLFRSGRTHMALVVAENDHLTPVGIVTLEDVVEEIIQGEIYDEKDQIIGSVEDGKSSPTSSFESLTGDLVSSSSPKHRIINPELRSSTFLSSSLDHGASFGTSRLSSSSVLSRTLEDSNSPTEDFSSSFSSRSSSKTNNGSAMALSLNMPSKPKNHSHKWNIPRLNVGPAITTSATDLETDSIELTLEDITKTDDMEEEDEVPLVRKKKLRSFSQIPNSTNSHDDRTL